MPRYFFPGQPQHIIQRGNNRSPIFIADEDYAYFHYYLQEASVCHGCHIHAYVFMTNHIHLLVTPAKEDSIAKTMQSIGRCYVPYFNTSHHRTGALWEGRYKAALIDCENYLFTCSRYIELNPVRAKIVSDPGEYQWSSYRANALGKNDSLIRPHSLYLNLDKNETARQARYRELFQAQIDEKTLEGIRQATQKGWALGDDRFKNDIEEMFQRRARPLERGGDHRSVEFKKHRGKV